MEAAHTHVCVFEVTLARTVKQVSAATIGVVMHARLHARTLVHTHCNYLVHKGKDLGVHLLCFNVPTETVKTH